MYTRCGITNVYFTVSKISNLSAELAYSLIYSLFKTFQKFTASYA